MIMLFENASLLPPDWRTPDAMQSARVFNPGLLCDGPGWLLAYRVVTDADPRRRIALCRLDASFRIVDGSQLAMSDLVRFPQPEAFPPQATTWFADPRLYRFGGRLWLYWNSGWHEPQNCQFLQEIDAVSLRPIGTPRELVLHGARQKLEKNWMLFERTGALFAIYSVNPHRVLRFSLAGNGPIEFADASDPIINSGGFAQKYGGLRGGAPPVLHDGQFYSFCHSIEDAPDGYRYVASVYRFGAEPPFVPTDLPRAPLAIAVPASGRRKLPKLNAAVGEVIYPGGAAVDGGAWHVSVGIDDERSAIVRATMAEILDTLAPVTALGA